MKSVFESVLADAVSARHPSPSPVLSDAEVAQFHERGLIVAPLRLSQQTNAAMHASLEQLLAFRDDVAPESLICPHIPALGRGRDEEAIALAAEWFGYATRPEILDCVEALIGPDIVLWGSQVFCKPAHTGRRIPWHQDGKYWPMRPLATVSAWIAIDDATPENGNMRFIPGSHRAGRVVPHRFNGDPGLVLPEEVVPGGFDESAALDDSLDAGEFSLHDVFLIHGSEANRSDHRRAGFVARYMPASSVFERAVADNVMQSAQGAVRVDYATRPIWLLRGTDRSGRNDFTVGHDGSYRGGERVSDDV
jgi:ectoine hydroxylase-related dioxygenase (phytanoyl-CoA dioxygenase family)